ncbi:Maf family protein [Dichotomicrobium thermohalophilum]|uniref:Nucleoside triphosphate pyrophosphatase n=1 Tax=Dichotomicrobium thermohalophilum TaxID=933063 RepID=A0A397Q0Z4_9HYPH|nr:Maf family protein [Dichotomicrobium thermohalophilum]RIA55180.1 septum formation protein [Dichotomicrobium thermohalophilum]
MTDAAPPVTAGLQAEKPALILASASPARVAVLRSAGVAFTQQPSNLDESSVREALRQEDEFTQAGDIAELLALTKATQISTAEPDALVLGADQVLAIEDRALEKPLDFDAAREQLLELRGKTHVLHSAVCLCRGGQHLWTHVDTATMKMRDFSAEFVGRYLSLAGAAVLTSVGAYQLEGPGAQLFERVDGDYFTVLGLPLLPLLAKLREMEILLA